MNFLKDLDLKKILKIAGLSLVAIIVVSVGLTLIAPSFKAISQKNTGYFSAPGGYEDYYAESSYSQLSESYSATDSVARSNSGVSGPVIPSPSWGTTGDTAEEFEVTQYNVQIETRSLDKICATVAGLKAADYVIFEKADELKHYCNYVFKVKKEKTDEILGVIKGLKPKEFSESTYTIKKRIDNLTTEAEILEKKIASIDESLEKAIEAYDEVADLATRVQNVESLAKIIDSKINIIERLTQERIRVNSRLEQIERSKADQLDRLEYDYFYLSVIENKFIDGENIIDSWKAAIKKSISNINQFFQNVTLNLITIILFVLQYALYLLIILVVAKYGWQLVKYIWNK